MASGFAGGTAALVWSQYPDLSNRQLRQLLRNTARAAKGVQPDENDWDNQTGFGILDALNAVSLANEQITRRVEWSGRDAKLSEADGGLRLKGRLVNRGVFDAEKVIAVVYNGNPRQPASPEGTVDNPAPGLQIRQLGHAIVPVRGLHESAITIKLTEPPAGSLWVETFCLDRHDPGYVHRVEVTITE